MHFNNESDLNSNTKRTGGEATSSEAATGVAAGATGTATAASDAAGSCASSTDSGVVIIDNKTTFTSSNNFNNKNTNNNFIENIKNNNNKSNNSNNNNRSNPKDKRNESIFKSNDEKLENINRSDRSQPAVNIENFLMISEGKTVDQDAAGDERKREKSSGQRRCSPTVSIRSMSSISIVSIDENALDSSVVDSDSDCEADAEGVHSTYVVKKLGQQTTYAPNSPDLPVINKGLTVISQKISPGSINGSRADPGALAEQLLSAGTGGSCLAPPGQPQIGSIALTNSTDVTFGDKHFYEGPVTIQQFLIDSRDKAKSYDIDGNENPMYLDEHGAGKGGNYDAANGRPPPTQPESQSYKFIFNRKAVIITSTIIVLTMLAGILILTASNIFKSSMRKSKPLGDGDDSRKNIPINSTIDLKDYDEYVNGTLNVVRREEWSARTPQGGLDELKLPVHRVIISHTASDTCDRKDICAYRLQVIQAFHMDSMGWNDIGYNFLVGSDGRVYVGRGWDTQGAHTKGYNTDSVGISLIGTFTTVQPPPRQMLATQLLIEEGVRRLKLAPNYRIYGARQLGATESPGSALYALIQNWPHWSQKIG